MKKLIVFVLALGLLAVSCKNRSAAKTLEGTWSEVKIDGIDVPTAAQDQITFGKCSGGENKECDVTITDCCGGGSFNYEYTVIDKGETLVLKDNVGIISVSWNSTIQSLTDNELVIVWDWGGSGYTGTYTKQ